MRRKSRRASCAGTKVRILLEGRRDSRLIPANAAERLRISKEMSPLLWRHGGPYKLRFRGGVRTGRTEREVVVTVGPLTHLRFPGEGRRAKRQRRIRGRLF